MKFALVAMLAASSVSSGQAPAARHHRQRPHHRGCNTRKCDRRIDREWAHKKHVKFMRYLQHLSHMRAVPRSTSNWGTPATASWFDDSGGTGCGFHASNGMATLIVPCGSHVEICGPSACVHAVREDSGPYVAGRTFDLSPTLKASLGCGDLCDVRYAIG